MKWCRQRHSCLVLDCHESAHDLPLASSRLHTCNGHQQHQCNASMANVKSAISHQIDNQSALPPHAPSLSSNSHFRRGLGFFAFVSRHERLSCRFDGFHIRLPRKQRVGIASTLTPRSPSFAMLRCLTRRATVRLSQLPVLYLKRYVGKGFRLFRFDFDLGLGMLAVGLFGELVGDMVVDC